MDTNTNTNLQPEKPKKQLRSFVKPALIVVAFTVILAYALFHFDQLRKAGTLLMDAVSPFITGLFIAYILNVFMNLFENVVFGKWTSSESQFWAAAKRPVCIILAFTVVILIILAITLYIIPEIFRSLDLIIAAAQVNIPIYAKNITEWVNWIPLNSIMTRQGNFVSRYLIIVVWWMWIYLRASTLQNWEETR